MSWPNWGTRAKSSTQEPPANVAPSQPRFRISFHFISLPSSHTFLSLPQLSHIPALAAQFKMPQYRIEVSPNNRAGCKDTECKKRGDKITKGMIRLGSWVEINEHGSWAWKHWGCVSGQQLANIRELCDQGDEVYDCDAIDGFEELNDHPDVQEKVRRCVKQGFIDPEDFKGDPEKNVLGEKGIHLTAAQKRKKEAAAAAAADGDDSTPKQAKRGRKKAAVDDEDEPQPKKAKKAQGKAAKPVKEEEQEEEEEAEKPAPAKPARGRKAAAKIKEENDEEPAPVKRGRKPAAKKVKEEPEPEPEAEPEAEPEEEKPVAAPAKKGRRSSTKLAEKEKEKEAEEEKPIASPAAAAPAKRGRRSSTKLTQEIGRAHV